MNAWFADLTEHWPIDWEDDELSRMGDQFASLAAAWADASDASRLWLCVRYAGDLDELSWAVVTAGACVSQHLEGLTVEEAIVQVQASLTAALAQQRPHPLAAAHEWIQAGRCLFEAYEHLAAAGNLVSRFPKSAQLPAGERWAPDALARPRSSIAKHLVFAYRTARGAASNLRMARGGPMSSWGTDVVRQRHRYSPETNRVEPLRTHEARRG